jgi:hypothetical protein
MTQRQEKRNDDEILEEDSNRSQSRIDADACFLDFSPIDADVVLFVPFPFSLSVTTACIQGLPDLRSLPHPFQLHGIPASKAVLVIVWSC